MKRVKRFLTTPIRSLFSEPAFADNSFHRVKLQKRCVELSRREKDFVHAQVGIVSAPELKELQLRKARGSIFARPGSITREIYH